MEDFDLPTLDGTDVNGFLKAYRDSMKNQYDANVSSLNQQKRNADAQIMSAANKAGVMYSNFPQRSKIQNEANYLTNRAKLNSTYQTGLDKLRSNAVNAYNQIKSLEEAISDLNSLSSGSTSGNNKTNGTTDGTTDSTNDGTNDNNTNSGDDTVVFGTPFTGTADNNESKEEGGNRIGETIGGAITGSMLAPTLFPMLGLPGIVAGGIYGGMSGNKGTFWPF